MSDQDKPAVPAVYDFLAINSRCVELELEREFPAIMAHTPPEHRAALIGEKLRQAMTAIAAGELRGELGRHVFIEAPIADSGIGSLSKAYVDAQTLAPARDSYRDDSAPRRACDRCGMFYRGPAVYCSLKCAIADG